MRAYIAGPLFNQGERWFNEQIEARAVRAGLVTFLPQRDGEKLLTDGWSMEKIFELDTQAINEATLVIANLNGIATDAGTAWELGYAYANGKHLVGIHTDMRLRFKNQVVNLMIECAAHKLVQSLDELEAYLRAYVESRS